MVTIIKTTWELTDLRACEKGPVGFVPTMGNLHEGHISLLEQALDENDVVYFSIFVNPKQFGPKDDFSKYPRTLSDDVTQIQNCEARFPGKNVVVFCPADPQEVFPLDYTQTVTVPKLNSFLEGAQRPGHFDGVTTVVFRLFELVEPTKAYFGLKDYQQYLVIKQMVKDLALPVEIIGMPIKRGPAGLALSSRNQYLTSEQREESLILIQSLKKVAGLIEGKRTNLRKAKREIDILLLDSKWNYLEMRDAENLSDDLTKSKSITLLGVYQIGTTRLLDNLQLEIQ